MKLLDLIKIPLTTYQIQKVTQIDAFDFSKTEKKVNLDFGGVTNKYLAEGILHLKLYYVVALLDPKNLHAVSRSLDPFWHAHILHTKDYTDFCTSIFEQYIHHTPLDPDDVESVKEVSEIYNYTYEIYGKIFHTVNNDWFPKLTNSAISGPVCLHMRVSSPRMHADSIFPSLLLSKAA